MKIRMYINNFLKFNLFIKFKVLYIMDIFLVNESYFFLFKRIFDNLMYM